MKEKTITALRYMFALTRNQTHEKYIQEVM